MGNGFGIETMYTSFLRAYDATTIDFQLISTDGENLSFKNGKLRVAGLLSAYYQGIIRTGHRT